MQDDLAALKKGEAPSGFQIEKKFGEETAPKAPPAPTGPKITPPPPRDYGAELGKLEKSKPLPTEIQKVQEKPGIIPRTGLSKPTISIPAGGGFFDRFKNFSKLKKIILYVIVGAVGFIVTAYLVPYFASFPTSTVTPTPRLTPTQTPTLTPVSLESLFSISDSVTIALGPNFKNRFINSSETEQLLSSREPGLYSITGSDGAKVGFTEFFDSMSITTPDALKLLVDNDSFWLTLMYKSDDVTGFGFIVKLSNTNTAGEAATAVRSWENTITQALADTFGFNPNEAASVGFLDNTYNGVAVRYKNFPTHNTTIDYAVIQAQDGQSYLVMVNSREHIYEIIDMLD